MQQNAKCEGATRHFELKSKGIVQNTCKTFVLVVVMYKHNHIYLWCLTIVDVVLYVYIEFVLFD